MTWTVMKEERGLAKDQDTGGIRGDMHADKIHVRAIIDIDNEQAELKDLIASLQKHVKET